MKNVLDISEHNGTIDFAKVKQAGYKDIILRLGWIGNKSNHTLDSKFEEYYTNCKRYGFNIGIYVYTYCTSLTTLRQGLEWCKNKLKNKEINLPIFIDFEDSQISSLSKTQLTNQGLEFCKYFEKLGYKSGVYASGYWFKNKLDQSKLLNYKIWWAEYNGESKPSSKLKVDLWQYTSSGKVNGIKGKVDISKCMCDCNDNNNESGDFEVKEYVNGSKKETVYQDANCSKVIGYLNAKEKCSCYGIVNNKALIVYKIDGTKNQKTGFVKWLGGIK